MNKHIQVFQVKAGNLVRLYHTPHHAEQMARALEGNGMAATITVEQVNQLIASNHVVAAYPRKKQIVVDGFKRFSASPAAIKAAQGVRVHAAQ
jgi:fucose permease